MSLKNDVFVGKRWHFSCARSPRNGRASWKKAHSYLQRSLKERGTSVGSILLVAEQITAKLKDILQVEYSETNACQ